MLTGILTKPANIDKGQDNIMTLDRDALLADVVANKDSYFHQLGRWSQVLITYQSSEGFQLNHLEFDPTTGAFPTANFNPSSRARNTWLVQSVMIRDLDDGEVIYYRDEVDTAHFDITLDQIAPTLTFVGISSNNTNPAIANIGDVITINFNSDEALQNVSATIAGQAASISGSGTSWSASYTLVGGETAGLVSFSIDYQDLAGNQGTQVTSTTNGSSVTIQYIVPSINLLQISSNNATLGSSKAVTGDTVTVIFNSDGPIDNINMVINGGAVVPSNVGLYQYEATYSVTAGSPDGNVSFIISYTDLYNNPGVAVTQNDTTDNSFVEIDNTAPQLSFVNITSTSGNIAGEGDDIILTFTADEQINTPTVTILGNSVTATNTSANNWRSEYTVLATTTEGTVTFTIDFEDDHENQGTQVTTTTNGSSVEVILDNIPPTLTAVSLSSDHLISGNSYRARLGDTVRMDVTSSEPLGSFKITDWCNDSSSNSTLIKDQNDPQELTYYDNEILTYNYLRLNHSTGTTGTINFETRYRDVAGNEGTPVTATTDGSSIVYETVRNAIVNPNIPSSNEYGNYKGFNGTYLAITDDSTSHLRNIDIYKKQIDNSYTLVNNITRPVGSRDFGDKIEVTVNNYIIILANDSTTLLGKLHLYKINVLDDSVTLVQTINLTYNIDLLSGNLSFDSNYLIIGDPTNNQSFLYELNTGSDTLTLVNTISAPVTSNSTSRFSEALKIKGDDIIIGEPRYHNGTGNIGRVHIYRKDISNNVTILNTINHSTPASNINSQQEFGSSVDYDGTYLVTVTDPNENSNFNDNIPRYFLYEIDTNGQDTLLHSELFNIEKSDSVYRSQVKLDQNVILVYGLRSNSTGCKLCNIVSEVSTVTGQPISFKFENAVVPYALNSGDIIIKGGYIITSESSQTVDSITDYEKIV